MNTMEWILNDLSLEGRYHEVHDFVSDIEKIVKLRFSYKNINDSFLCPRNIGDIKVLGDKTFSQLVLAQAPRDLKVQIMAWVSKKGPFWCDSRTFQEDDYFEHNNIDVTDLGLGECGRKVIMEQDVTSYSFSGEYSQSPLAVQHGLSEQVFGNYEIVNLWSEEQLIASSKSALPLPVSWKTALDVLESKYVHLLFSPELIDQISTLPYNRTVFERMDELCRVLEEYLSSRTKEGEASERTIEILSEFFRGRKAWFSDETDEDKKNFEHDLKFLDSRDQKSKKYSFHGKIKTPQVRVYFEWPIPPEQKDIQIVYFGPKITKK